MSIVSDTLMDEKINALVPTHPRLRQAQARLLRCWLGVPPDPRSFGRLRTGAGERVPFGIY